MTANDQMHRFIFDDTDIRGEAVTLADSYQQILQHHHLPSVVNNLLGEFLAAASLLASTLKFDGILTLQARGEGPLPIIMAECTNDKQLRAIARPNPDANFDELTNASLQELLGKGMLSIIIRPTQGKQYQGIVPLENATLADCLAHYFQQSEQLDTRFWLAADGTTASGLLLQALPQQKNASPEANQDSWETSVALADTVKSEELLSLPHSELLYRLFHEQAVRLFEPESLKFQCSCSKERSGEMLRSIGHEEAKSILAEQGHIEMDCQFCGQFYRFNDADVEALFSRDNLH